MSTYRSPLFACGRDLQDNCCGVLLVTFPTAPHSNIREGWDHISEVDEPKAYIEEMVSAEQISGPVNIQKIQLKMRNRRTGSELSKLVWSIRCVIFQLAAEHVGLMQQFLNVLAELKGKKFYLAGESVRSLCSDIRFSPFFFQYAGMYLSSRFPR